jgi:hypothetical protein
MDSDKFRKVPNTPFAYWVDDSIRDLFVKLPRFESEGRTVKQGLATADDFRFVRAWWEVDAERRLDPGLGGSPDWRTDLSAFQAWCRKRTHQGKYWVPFAKGGEYSPYYSDIHLVVNWKNEGEEIKQFVCKQYPYLKGNADYVVKNTDYYFRPGVTWPGSTVKGLNARAMPAGCIFSHKGMVAFPAKNEDYELFLILALMNSAFFQNAIYMQNGSRAWEVGLIQNAPFGSWNEYTTKIMLDTCNAIVLEIACVLETDETTLLANSILEKDLNGNNRIHSLRGLLEKKSLSIEELICQGYRLKYEDEITQDFLNTLPKDFEHAATEQPTKSEKTISFFFSTVFGRNDVRPSLNGLISKSQKNPFDFLPVVPSHLLLNPSGLPATSGNIVSEEWLHARPDAVSLPPPDSVVRPTIPDSEYPIPIPWDGVLAEDPDSPDDLVARIRLVLKVLHGERAEEVERELAEGLGVRDLRDYVSDPMGFFDAHLKTYSKSRRRAPIYWPLSTKSGGYTVWVYYPRLTDSTLYAVHELARKKAEVLELERAELAGRKNRNRAEQQRFDRVSRDLGEVRDFAQEVLRIASLPYKPDHDDGVPTCAAPLHGLFRHSGWSKYLKGIWEELKEGKYDWAHLAYAIWPDRVRSKARKDRSIAIAHGLEDHT